MVASRKTHAWCKQWGYDMLFLEAFFCGTRTNYIMHYFLCRFETSRTTVWDMADAGILSHIHKKPTIPTSKQHTPTYRVLSSWKIAQREKGSYCVYLLCKIASTVLTVVANHHHHRRAVVTPTVTASYTMYSVSEFSERERK